MSRYVVTCEDGARRHAYPFASRAEADRFAWWGHCCTATHCITSTSSAPCLVCDDPTHSADECPHYEEAS